MKATDCSTENAPSGGSFAVTATATGTHSICFQPQDAAGNALYGKPATVALSGVGTLYDQSNSPVTGNSQTVVVGTNGLAQVTVDSGTPGKQVVTGTTDGVAGSVTLSYTGEFVPVSPTRVLDTRTGGGGISGPLSPNTRATFNLTAASDVVPAEAQAVAVNITINPGGVGNLKVWPGDVTTVPPISVLNYQPGQATANFGVIPLGAASSRDKTLNLYSQGSASNVLIDVVGYYLHHARTEKVYKSGVHQAPTRVVDTRNTGGPVKANTVVGFQVGGVNGLPGPGITTDNGLYDVERGDRPRIRVVR